MEVTAGHAEWFEQPLFGEFSEARIGDVAAMAGYDCFDWCCPICGLLFRTDEGARMWK